VRVKDTVDCGHAGCAILALTTVSRADVRGPILLLASRLRRIQSHCIVHDKMESHCVPVIERMAEHLGGFGVPQPYPPIDINNIVMCEAPEEYQMD
jgi:hypothetical protein